MANFKRLTRGLKLLTDHVYTPVSTVLSNLTSTGVSESDYDKKFGTFRININIPYVNNFPKQTDDDRNTAITVPFVLPALQEEFDLDNSEIEDYELIEISVSQDTRGEAGRLLGIRRNQEVNGEGVIVPGEGNGFTVYLMEKETETTGIGSRAKNEIFKINIPDVLLLDSLSRANPFVQTGISVPIRHDRSYLLEFVPTKNGQAFFSVTISLKLKRKLTSRDVNNAGQTDVQNMPAHLGAFNNVAQTANAPASNAQIESDSATGVYTNFKLIDSIISRGLRGGYEKSGRRRYAENLKSDAGYEVIAVPMFASWFASNQSPGPVIADEARDIWSDPQDFPWALAGAGGFNTMDRAIIPLHYPMTIHHVLIGVNYTHAKRDQAAVRPTQLTFTHEVGVGLLQGIRAEDFAVQQIAHAQWNPTGGANPIDNYLVDRMASGISLSTNFYYLWDILSCPLVGTGGNGYIAQGKPVFAAKGETGTNIRSNIGTPAALPVTRGGEQALDIRWKISDTADSATVNGSIVGWPGHWVYIIGKKHLI